MRPTTALAALASISVAHGQLIGNHPPKLVVLISIDQFRADYVERYSPYFLPTKSGKTLGGFKYLTETGSWYLDAHHNHIPTATGPGHATLMTGSEPAYDGIIGNDWFNRETGKGVYCVDDASVETVGGTSKPMSPRNLRVTTIGDELKLATGGRSKVVGISFKDRAAILMAGHAADTVIWFDSGTGNWVTSSFYAPSKQLPEWVAALNSEKVPQKKFGSLWEPLLAPEAYSLTRRNPNEKPAENGKLFSHSTESATKSGKQNYDGFTRTSFGQEYVFDTIERALDSEKLGAHDVPDVLVVNLATNDYVGHPYGPDSPEVMDITVRTDRLLSGLINSLDRRIGIDNVALVVTADHGVLPVVEESADRFRTGSIRVTANFKQVIDESLTKTFGPGEWVLGDGLYEQNLYLNRRLAQEKGLSIPALETAAAQAASTIPGVFAAYTRSQILKGELPALDVMTLVSNGFGTDRGGDVMVFEAPGAYFGGGGGTGHGSLWAYDTHVPILVHAKGVKPGRYFDTVHTSDIASTLAHLLGIEYPTGNVGRPLPGMK